MFGYGIYYAPKAEKSMGYTSFGYWTRGNSTEGYMALMEVAYGKPYDVHAFDSKYYNFNYDRLQEALPGANCLHAHAGSMLRNDEIIVYKEISLEDILPRIQDADIKINSLTVVHESIESVYTNVMSKGENK